VAEPKDARSPVHVAPFPANQHSLRLWPAALLPFLTKAGSLSARHFGLIGRGWRGELADMEARRASKQRPARRRSLTSGTDLRHAAALAPTLAVSSRPIRVRGAGHAPLATRHRHDRSGLRDANPHRHRAREHWGPQSVEFCPAPKTGASWHERTALVYGRARWPPMAAAGVASVAISVPTRASLDMIHLLLAR
jgi:hypothetical protein